MYSSLPLITCFNVRYYTPNHVWSRFSVMMKDYSCSASKIRQKSLPCLWLYRFWPQAGTCCLLWIKHEKIHHIWKKFKIHFQVVFLCYECVMAKGMKGGNVHFQTTDDQWKMHLSLIVSCLSPHPKKSYCLVTNNVIHDFILFPRYLTLISKYQKYKYQKGEN